MKIHPMAGVLPALSEAETEALRASIKRVGQCIPILVCNGQIIDGRARYWACRELGIEPKFTYYGGPDDEISILNVIVSVNISRRHLTISQRAAIGANAMEAFRRQAKERLATNVAGQGRKTFANAEKGRASTLAGQAFGVNRVYIQAAEAIKQALPAVFDEVLAGTISLAEAGRILKRTQAAAGTRSPIIRAPKLSVPAEASRLLCVWGTEAQVEQVRNVVGEKGIPYMRADRQDGKWITAEKAVA